MFVILLTFPLNERSCALQTVSSNKSQVREMYAQIDDFAESLARAVPDVTMLSPAAKIAIQALAE